MLSTMPFAIAQVDEVGFIFLAQMATSIINICRTSNATDEEILATALCWIVLSTALLGLAMVLTGKLHLAALVHYFPLPVLGGYLAYIGFCKCAKFILVLACSLHDCVPHLSFRCSAVRGNTGGNGSGCGDSDDDGSDLCKATTMAATVVVIIDWLVLFVSHTTDSLESTIHRFARPHTDCLEAGVSLMTGKQVDSVDSWHQLLNRDSAILLAPGLSAGAAMVSLSARFQSTLLCTWRRSSLISTF
jgi:hypothetical protein